MIKQAQLLYDQLVEKLREAEVLPPASPVQRHETNLKLISGVIHELKQLVIHHSFPDEQEEIFFFKHIKPKFTSLLVYHSRLAQIELRLPLGGLKDIRKHFENELLLIRMFYDDHAQLYQYMLSGFTFHDAKLFVRGNCDLPFYYSTATVDADMRFSTHYDYIVGCLQANERLRDYLLGMLRELDKGYLPTDQPQQVKSTLHWTGSKVYLIELTYALHESGQINNGSIGLMELALQLEEFFHVKLGNVYRTFQEMRQRKKDSRTKLLDLMKERLLHRMDDLDAF